MSVHSFENKIRDDTRNICVISLFYVLWTNGEIELDDFIILLLNVVKQVLKCNRLYWKYDKEQNTVALPKT